MINLTTACLKCNQQKDNQLPDEFLAESPDKLRELLTANPRRSYRDATWLNTTIPFLIRKLEESGNPVEQANGAQTSWNRKQMQLPKTHYIDAAVLGNCQSLTGMPELVTHIKPSNGRRKQKANVDENGGLSRETPFKRYCRLSPRERSRTPTPGHAGKRTHFGPQLIATGDIVTIQNRNHGAITGRAVMYSHGKRVRIRGESSDITGLTRTTRLVRRNPGYIRTMVGPGPTK